MFPVYKYLDSYPQPTHQRYHTPYPHHYPPWEGVPPRTPENYEPLPYPNSAECHGCCSHGYPSGFYNYRPPHSHLPPHPGYFHGAYPSYPDSYPAYFFPPHYSTAQPQYEYDKNIPRYHCCECPNHSHFPKSESSVKIEEQKPETENKKDYDDSSSAIKFPNNPLAWFPPGYMKDREVNKQKEEPKFQNGWNPLEMNCNRLPKTGGEEERNQRSGEEKKTQFPLPIIWMPGYNKPEESEKKELKEINVDPGDAKDSPKLKFIPLKLLEKDNHEDKPNLTEVPGDKEKVKEAPKNMQNAAVADKEKKIKSIPVKQVEENEKANENGNKKSSSPAKISKLPPVCLRVDPLPGKKTKVSKSRSPSPPGEKERAQQAHLFDSKLQKQVADDTKQEGLENKVTTNTEKVDKKDENPAKVRVEVPVVSKQDDSEKTVKEGENQIPVVFKDVSDKTATDKEDQRVTRKDVRVVEVAKGQTEVEKKKITSEEAAILIQSAYRGFEVRRLEPLKKLKQIARVQEQVGGIREGISGLEASAERRKDEKQRLVISETIMGLLLQLDTIQGLHPSVREVRKAVARELVFLQEKLDSLSTSLTDEEPESTVVKDIIDNSAEDNNQTVLVCGSVSEGLSCKTEEFAEPPLARDEKLDSEVEVVAELPVLEDEKSQSNSEETAKLSILNAESEFAEPPLVRDEKLDSKVELVAQLPVSEDGKLHSDSVESSELSVENLESAGSKMEEFANSLVTDEEPISKVESIDLPLLEDEKAEPELEEFSSPSLAKDEPMEQVEPESEPDELLQPRFVKDENVEEPESQPEKSAEQVEPESEPDELQTYVNDETVVTKDEIVELPVSQPEESAELQSNPKELREPESELEHPSVEIDENLEGPEPKIKESVLVEDANVNSEPDKSGGLSVEGDENAYSDIVGFSETSVNGDRGFVRKEFPTLEKEIDHTEHDSLDMTNGRISQSVTGAVDGEKIETGANRISESMISMMDGEETETRETEVAELGKSATDSDMEAIESCSTEEVVGNGNIESKSATNFTAQTFEISPHSGIATENSDENHVTVETAEDKSPVEVEENLQVDFEVAEEVSSREVIKDGDFQERRKGEHKLEENETLREMVEILVEAGKKQLNAITDLSERVRDLEKRLIKKKQKVRRHRVKGSSCSRVVSNLVKESSSSSHLC